jgi:Domain of unknown function (DUF4168)
MKFSRLLQISGLVCVAATVAPSFTVTATANETIVVPSQIALLQSVSDDDLRKYAAAYIEIEPLRVEALNAVSSRVSGDLPKLMCNQPDSMGSLPTDARRIFVRYCAQSNEIVSRKGLSVATFNRITSQISSNSQLRKRLEKQVNCLQSGGC